MNVIESKNLTKTYGNFKALRDLSFTIKENTITGLIGRNGAGKTTLLKLLTGFYHPTSGDVQVFSQDPFNNLKVSANLIFIDDQMVFPPGLNLGDLLKSAEHFYPNWDAELAKRLFDYFDLRPKMSHHHLSKGMKSTFNMIVGLTSRCAITIFDEPTTGMDASVRKDFYKALLKDYIEHPRTIIFSSHLLNEIDSFLEDILLIKNGEKVLHMPVIDLKEYAIGISGKAEAVASITEHMEILHQETFGNGSSYKVVHNIFTVETRLEAKRLGLEFLPVATDDLCVYLTSKNKGGIDDVFNRG